MIHHPTSSACHLPDSSAQVVLVVPVHYVQYLSCDWFAVSHRRVVPVQSAAAMVPGADVWLPWRCCPRPHHFLEDGSGALRPHSPIPSRPHVKAHSPPSPSPVLPVHLSICPSVLRDFDSLDQMSVEDNTQLGFDVAEQGLGISPLMSVEEMSSAGGPDSLSMVMYLSQFYQLFKDTPPAAGQKPSSSPL